MVAPTLPHLLPAQRERAWSSSPRRPGCARRPTRCRSHQPSSAVPAHGSTPRAGRVGGAPGAAAAVDEWPRGLRHPLDALRQCPRRVEPTRRVEAAGARRVAPTRCGTEWSGAPSGVTTRRVDRSGGKGVVKGRNGHAHPVEPTEWRPLRTADSTPVVGRGGGSHPIHDIGWERSGWLRGEGVDAIRSLAHGRPCPLVHPLPPASPPRAGRAGEERSPYAAVGPAAPAQAAAIGRPV